MSILSWNYQGCRSPSIGRQLKALIRIHKSQIIFLAETKGSCNWVQSKLKLSKRWNVQGVDAVGLSGGLCLIWSGNIRL